MMAQARDQKCTGHGGCGICLLAKTLGKSEACVPEVTTERYTRRHAHAWVSHTSACSCQMHDRTQLRPTTTGKLGDTSQEHRAEQWSHKRYSAGTPFLYSCQAHRAGGPHSCEEGEAARGCLRSGARAQHTSDMAIHPRTQVRACACTHAPQQPPVCTHTHGLLCDDPCVRPVLETQAHARRHQRRHASLQGQGRLQDEMHCWVRLQSWKFKRPHNQLPSCALGCRLPLSNSDSRASRRCHNSGGSSC